MKDIHMGTAEMQFADLVWQNQPINSTALVNLAGEVMNWQKSTSYTVLKRLCAKGVLKNEKSTVTALISKEEYLATESQRIVGDLFGGSIPMFLAAFREKADLSEEDWACLRRMIEEHEEK